MTEYEVAQLAIAEGLRTQGAVALMQTMVELASYNRTSFITFLFGYLLTAHFVGANLTKAQLIILNVFFVITASVYLFDALTHMLASLGFWEYMYAISPEAFSSPPPTLTLTWILTVLALNIGMVLAALYFMWTVRRPKAE